jgi:hypothetical protein
MRIIRLAKTLILSTAAIAYLPLQVEAQSSIDTASFMAARKYCELRNAGFKHIPSWNDAILAQERGIWREEVTANKKRSDYFGARTMERIEEQCPEHLPSPASSVTAPARPKSAGCSNFIMSGGTKVCL